jgi:hypothetical protein
MKNKQANSKLKVLHGKAQKRSINENTLVSKIDDEVLPFSPKGKGKLALIPSVNGGAVIESFQNNVLGKDADLSAMIEMLEQSIQQVGKDDLSGLEAMLVSQANALQTIFTSLARRASSQESLPLFQAYMGLALKAQSQSRSTISALVDLKNPKQATYVGQANMTTGPQQVNNLNLFDAEDKVR